MGDFRKQKCDEFSISLDTIQVSDTLGIRHCYNDEENPCCIHSFDLDNFIPYQLLHCSYSITTTDLVIDWDTVFRLGHSPTQAAEAVHIAYHAMHQTFGFSKI